jgi:hypothetical protein
MELQVKNPALQAKIDKWVAETGLPANELVEDALEGYLVESLQVRQLLDKRYEDVRSGKVELIDGEEALARLKKNTESQPNRTP